MSSLQASRTLVKSPPELWAELSDLGSLARHLGEFGEIRITQVDPESRVDWEADRASGSVRLEPSGWGTRVVLTVDTPEPAADPEPEAEAAAEPEATAVAEPEMEPQAEAETAVEPEAAVVAEPEAEAVAEPEAAPVDAAEPQAAEPGEPDPSPEPLPLPEPKRGFWARLFGRRKLTTPPPAPEPTEPDPEPEIEEPVAVEPDPAEDEAFGTIEWEIPEPVAEEPEPEPEPVIPADPHAVLNNVLDTLGAAHHRPFSRS